MALIENDPESMPTPEKLMRNEEFSHSDIILSDIGTELKIIVTGLFSPSTKSEIIKIASEYDFPVAFDGGGSSVRMELDRE
jgi:hypothetical protein